MNTLAGSSSWRWLRTINPLAKIVAVLPAIVWVFASESPAVSIGCGVVAAVLLLTGERWSARTLTLGIVLVPLAVVVLSLLFAVWTDPDAARLGDWTDSVTIYPGVFGTVTLSAVLIASETALRICAIALLSLLSGVGSSRTDLTDALMQNAKMPYRIGYTAYAAIGYLPMMAEQWQIIKAAQRVRGGRVRRGPFAVAARYGHSAVALLIDALRHADRMALALESRSFGAHPQRSWRRIMPWRVRDTSVIVAGIASTCLAITMTLVW